MYDEHCSLFWNKPFGSRHKDDIPPQVTLSAKSQFCMLGLNNSPLEHWPKCIRPSRHKIYFEQSLSCGKKQQSQLQLRFDVLLSPSSSFGGRVGWIGTSPRNKKGCVNCPLSNNLHRKGKWINLYESHFLKNWKSKICNYLAYLTTLIVEKYDFYSFYAFLRKYFDSFDFNWSFILLFRHIVTHKKCQSHKISKNIFFFLQYFSTTITLIMYSFFHLSFKLFFIYPYWPKNGDYNFSLYLKIKNTTF